MKKSYLVTFAACMMLLSFDFQRDWSDISSIKVYHVSDDSLSGFGTKSIDNERMVALLKKSELLISVYGGFFMDISTNTFFQMPEDQRDKWDDLIGSSLKQPESCSLLFHLISNKNIFGQCSS